MNLNERFPTIGSAEEWVRDLDHTISKKEWQRTPESHALLIDKLLYVKHNLGTDYYERAYKKIREAMNWREEPFRHLLALKDIRDVRRAFKAQGMPEEPMLTAEEKQYPTTGWIGAYLKWCRNAEVPLAYHFWCGMAALGAACRRNIYYDRGNHYLYPNQYLLLIGPQGIRKSQAIDAMLEVLKKSNKWLEQAEVSEEKRIKVLPESLTAPKLVEMMRVSGKVDLPSPKELSYFSSGRKDIESNAILANGEASTLLGKQGFGTDHMVSVLTELYNCPQEWTHATLTRGKDPLYNVALSVVLASTPSWLRDVVTPAVFTGGFMSRMIVCCRDTCAREYGEAPPIDPVLASSLAENLLEWHLIEDPIEFKFDAAWKSIYTDWYHEHKEYVREQEMDEYMEGWFIRKDLHITKLSMMLAISNGRVLGNAEDFELARKLLHIEEQHFMKGFDEIARHPNDVKKVRLMRFLVREGGVVTRTRVSRVMFKTLGGTAELNELTEMLQQERKIAVENTGRAGGGQVYRVIDWDWDKVKLVESP